MAGHAPGGRGPAHGPAVSDRVRLHFGHGPLGIAVAAPPVPRRVDPRSLREGVLHWHREGAPARTARDFARGLTPPLLAALGMWALLAFVDRPDESAIAIVPFETAPPLEVAQLEPVPVPVPVEPEPEPVLPEPEPIPEPVPQPKPVRPEPPPPPVARPQPPPPPEPAPRPRVRPRPEPAPAPRRPAPQIDRLIASAQPPPEPVPARRAPARAERPRVAPPPPVRIDRVAEQEPAPAEPVAQRARALRGGPLVATRPAPGPGRRSAGAGPGPPGASEPAGASRSDPARAAAGPSRGAGARPGRSAAARAGCGPAAGPGPPPHPGRALPAFQCPARLAAGRRRTGARRGPVVPARPRGPGRAPAQPRPQPLPGARRPDPGRVPGLPGPLPQRFSRARPQARSRSPGRKSGFVSEPGRPIPLRGNQERECLPDGDRGGARPRHHRSLRGARVRPGMSRRCLSGGKMKALLSLAGALALALPAVADESAWTAYLDYAYVFASADEESLRARLKDYGREAGIRLEDYVPVAFGERALAESADPEADTRRAAIARLLLYLAYGEPEELEASADLISRLQERLERHENRYWFHYILAHRALERGRPADFTGELLDLWLHVVVPLEAPYETLRTLSLSDAPGSGFVSALPYVYENVARILLIRSPKMGVTSDLDPLGAIVRMLHDGRVGNHPDVIPVELSSRGYVERVATRLDGVESDGGSLTFTLALYEASRYHDEARAALASHGLGPETVEALRVASGAYESALDRAQFLQGKAAVHIRALQQLGEVYAAKQRLGVNPEIEMPLGIESAIDLYGRLKQGSEQRTATHGYTSADVRNAAMRRLWEEIQETSLNAADYYLTRSVEDAARGDEHARSAARIYARYLAMFQRFATPRGREAVPDSAYFAAYEAARGYGDALLTYTRGRVSNAEMEQASRNYVAALHLFPFDRHIWPGLATTLARLGKENRYLDLARPVAEAVNTSRHVDLWIQHGEPGATQISALRRAFADTQALVYLGFAEENTVHELESSLAELRGKRDRAKREMEQLMQQRASLGRRGSGSAPPAAADDGGPSRAVSAMEVEALDRKLAETKLLVIRYEKQIDARTRALPLFKATLGTEGLVDELRARRDHPVHSLLRRMYHESRA